MKSTTIINYKNKLKEQYPVSFFKTWLFIVVKFVFKIINYFFRTTVEREKCDVLVMCAYNQEVVRTKNLRSKLTSQGLEVCYDLYSKKRFIKERVSSRGINLNLLVEESDVRYLIEKYSPKIIITFSHNSVYSSLLRNYLNDKGGKLINIAHAVIGQTHEFSMFDFDYYFIFGKSSIEGAMRSTLRFGNTNLILSGSIFLPENLKYVKSIKNKNILFFSTWLAESVKDELMNNAKIVVRWAKKHSDYQLFIKLHHHEDPSFISELCKGVKNIVILNKSTSMVDALTNVSIVITSWSNAAIEAAVASKPIVIVNSSNVKDDYLKLEDFFQKRSQHSEKLHEAIKNVLLNYDSYVLRCHEFVRFHYFHQTGVTDFISKIIKEIFEDKEPINTIPIQGNFNYD